MKQTTFEKYIDFLRSMVANGKIHNITIFARECHVSDAFVNFLIKNKYLISLAGGSVKLIDCPLGFNHIVNEYKKQSEMHEAGEPLFVATLKGNGQCVTEFGKSLSEAYPHVTNTGQMSDELTTEQREKAAIAILGSIMRDNAGITYDLIRIERKETKTDLLKR